MAFDFQITEADLSYNDFSPLPAGDYEVVIENSEFTRTRTTGKDMLKVTMKVIKGNCINRKVFDYIVDNEFAKEKICRILKATKVPANGNRFLPNMIINKNCVVEVECTSEGKNNVKKYKQMTEIADKIPMGNASIDPNLAPPLSDEPPF